MAQFVIAEKNGQRKPFTQYAWDLMGGEKSGWKLVGENQPVESQARKVDMPETGTKPAKNQPVDNLAIEKKDQPVDNLAGDEKDESETTAPESGESSSQSFSEFAKANLKRNSIKNFLDIKKVKYKQNDSDDVLISKIAAFLKNDVESLKTEFGL